MKNSNDSQKTNRNANHTDLPPILSGPLPTKIQELEKMRDELYQKLLSPHGHPDYSLVDPIKERIKQVEFKIELINSRKLKKREIIFLIIGIIGAITGILSNYQIMINFIKGLIQQLK